MCILLLLSLLHVMLAIRNMVNVTNFCTLFCRFCSGVVGKMLAVFYSYAQLFLLLISFDVIIQFAKLNT